MKTIKAIYWYLRSVILLAWAIHKYPPLVGILEKSCKQAGLEKLLKEQEIAEGKIMCPSCFSRDIEVTIKQNDDGDYKKSGKDFSLGLRCRHCNQPV